MHLAGNERTKQVRGGGKGGGLDAISSPVHWSPTCTPPYLIAI